MQAVQSAIAHLNQVKEVLKKNPEKVEALSLNPLLIVAVSSEKEVQTFNYIKDKEFPFLSLLILTEFEQGVLRNAKIAGFYSENPLSEKDQIFVNSLLIDLDKV